MQISDDARIENVDNHVDKIRFLQGEHHQGPVLRFGVDEEEEGDQECFVIGVKRPERSFMNVSQKQAELERQRGTGK